MTRSARMAVLAAALAALIGPAGGHDRPAAAETEAVELGLTEYAFTPSEIVAPAGAVTLYVTNWGNRRHNMVVFVDGAEVDLPHLRPGDTTSWEVVLDRPGTYRFWCGEYRHLEKGMVGEITVE